MRECVHLRVVHTIYIGIKGEAPSGPLYIDQVMSTRWEKYSNGNGEKREKIMPTVKTSLDIPECTHLDAVRFTGLYGIFRQSTYIEIDSKV